MTARKQLLAIDCETDPFQHGRIPRPFVWGQFDGEKFESFWQDEHRFVEQLLARRCYAYAHNGGRFDFIYLLRHCPEGTRLVIDRENRVQQAFPNDRCELRDSYPALRFALAEQGKLPMDYAKCDESVREQHREEITAYLRRDCEALFELISEFHERYGRRPVTIGQAAIAELRRIQQVRTPRTSQVWDSRFRPFYFGGRCEAVQVGELRGPWQGFDVNGAYAHAMRSLHPWGHTYAVHDRLPDFDAEHLSRCMIDFDGVAHGALPYRNPQGMVGYPRHGHPRRYRVTGHEFLAADATGHLRIDRIRRVIDFDDAIDFDPFVTEYWREREVAKGRGDRAGELIAKQMLTSLYGKLGQDARRHSRYQLTSHDRFWRDLAPDGWDQAGDLAQWCVAQKPEPEGIPRPYFHVAAAASITGAVRARLWTAWQRSEGVAYVDTDSILCRSLDPQQTVGPGLGDWKYEGSFTEAFISGPKLYAFRRRMSEGGGWRTAHRGARLTPAELIDLARGGTIRYHSDRPTMGGVGRPTFQHRTYRRRERP